MKYKFIIVLLVTSYSLISQKIESKPNKRLESSFDKIAKGSASDTSEYSDYAKASSNNIYYNNGLGESKYDKEMNLDTDINPNDVKGSIENFRTKKRNEEIWLKTKILISLFIIAFALYYLRKYLMRIKVL